MALRAAWLALFLTIGLVSVANAQGGAGIGGLAPGVPGVFLPHSCTFIGTDSRGVPHCTGTGTNVSIADEIVPASTGVLALTFDQVEPPYVGFWTNTDNNPNINVMRLRERLFIGDCVGVSNARVNNSNTWIPDAATGANWIPRDSQVCVMGDRGTISFSALAKSSLGDDVGAAAIAGAFATIYDSTTANHFGWGMYVEVQHQPSGAQFTGASFGIECDMKNKTTWNPNPTIYGTFQGGTYCLWLAGGGDSTFGGASVRPSTAAIFILSNTNSWNAGIAFKANALTGTTGDGTGVGNAIMLATGHRILWEHPPDDPSCDPSSCRLAAQINSYGLTTGHTSEITFRDDQVTLSGSDNAHPVFITNHVFGTTGWNGIQVDDSITGVSPIIHPTATGDTNVSMRLTGRGSGVVIVTNDPTIANTINTFTVKDITRSFSAFNVDTVHADAATNYSPVASAPYALQVGGATIVALNLSPGDLGFYTKTLNLGANAAPGAGGGKIAMICDVGHPGTMKLVAYAGTSFTPTTIMDNIGAGVSGC